MGSLSDLWYSFRKCRVPEKKGETSKPILIIAASRLCVIPMTIYSVIIGGLLAYLTSGHVSIPILALLLVGFTLAHLSDNLINDYYDYKRGLDTYGYFRNMYGPHPFADGLLTGRDLALFLSIVGLLDAGLAIYLSAARTPLIGLLAVIGVAVMAAYAGIGFDAKTTGLGELLVAIVWGPVMVGGTILALTGRHPLRLLAVYTPYALSVSNVLVGKHLDKYEQDKRKNVGTLPVRLGFHRAQQVSALLAVGLPVLAAIMIAQEWGSIYSLLPLAGLPLGVVAARILLAPKPGRPPEAWDVWPLWYVAAAYASMDALGRDTIAALLALILASSGHGLLALVIVAVEALWDLYSAYAFRRLTGI